MHFSEPRLTPSSANPKMANNKRAPQTDGNITLVLNTNNMMQIDKSLYEILISTVKFLQSDDNEAVITIPDFFL